jgi:hypothetical protein
MSFVSENYLIGIVNVNINNSQYTVIVSDFFPTTVTGVIITMAGINYNK